MTANKVFKGFLSLMFLILVLGMANHYSPYRIIYSPQSSIAKGFYFSYPCTDLDLKTRGTMVSFTHPQEDWIPSGVISNYERLTKFMVGIEGDFVKQGDNSTILCVEDKCDEFNRIPEMPTNVDVGEIKKGEFFGVAGAFNSFDSRYTGNFKMSNILGCVVKL